MECYKAVAGESEYYVRKDVAERYLADAYDFSEWFIDLTEKPGRSKGIICDKKNVYEGLELKEELERVIQGNYTQGDFKILLGYDNSSAELRRIRGALRSVVCRHPLEWDESQFASESFAEEYRMVNRQTAVLSRAQARNLRKAAADTDIWRGGLERVFGRNEFNFYHPLYFLHYLDKATLRIKTLEVAQESPTCKLQLWERDYTTADDLLLERELTIDGDEVETEIEFNFDVERVVDEEELELEIIPKLILNDKIQPHENSILIVEIGGQNE